MDILESSDDEADAAAAPAPAPTVAPLPADVAVETRWTVELLVGRDAARADRLQQRARRLEQRARGAAPAAGDEWRTEGHALLQTRVAKYDGARRTPYTGTIVGWDPLGFEGVAPLFHVVHDDGDEEDLEEHEVELGGAALQARGGARGRQGAQAQHRPAPPQRARPGVAHAGGAAAPRGGAGGARGRAQAGARRRARREGAAGFAWRSETLATTRCPSSSR